MERLVEFVSTPVYTGFGSSVVAVGRSGVFTPNLGTNGCPESFSRSGRFRVFGVKCREPYRAGEARLHDTTGAERFAEDCRVRRCAGVPGDIFWF